MKTSPKVFFPYHYTSANIDTYLQKYIKKGMSVYDVGTGTGILAILSKQYGANRVLATDISDDAIECAEENCKEYNIEVKNNYLNFDIDEKFDIVIANLDPNPAMEFLQYAQNTMKDDGILILTWWSKWDFKDLPLKFDYEILEHTDNFDFNAYVLKRRKNDNKK